MNKPFGNCVMDQILVARWVIVWDLVCKDLIIDSLGISWPFIKNVRTILCKVTVKFCLKTKVAHIQSCHFMTILSLSIPEAWMFSAMAFPASLNLHSALSGWLLELSCGRNIYNRAAGKGTNQGFYPQRIGVRSLPASPLSNGVPIVYLLRLECGFWRQRTVMKWNPEEVMVWIPQPKQKESYCTQTQESCV